MRTSQLSKSRLLAALAALALVTGACTKQTTDTSSETTTTTTTITTTTTEAVESHTYRIGILGDPTTDNFWAYLGPESDANNGYVLGESHAALFRVAYPNILTVPQLAEGEPNQAAQAGQVWVVEQKVRQGVKWSDGEELTAHDLVFAYEVTKEFGLDGRWAKHFALQAEAVEDDPATDNIDESSPARPGVTSITAPDDYTLRIEFSERPGLAVWQNGVGLAPFMPEHFWAEGVAAARASDDSAAALYALSGVGEPSAGPTIYQGHEPGVSVRADLNQDDYYAGTTYTFYADGSFRQKNDGRGFDEVYNGSGEGEITRQWTSGPYATDVLYSIFPDQNAAVLALRNGEIDLILSPLGLDSTVLDQITSAPDLNLATNVFNGFRYLAFNMRKSPTSFQGFRKAIGCTTDKEYMQSLLRETVAAYNLVPLDNVYWANSDVEELCRGMSGEERFNQAIELLKADGFTWAIEPEWDPDTERLRDGAGTGLTDPDGVPVPELELLAQGPVFDSLRSTYALWIAEWASNLGIPVKANLTSVPDIVDEAFALGEDALGWDMYILGWGLGEAALPTFHESFFASYQDSAQGGFNTSGYGNVRVDELVAELLAATDVNTVRAAVQEMDRIIVEEAPYVVLFQTPILEAYRNTLLFPYTDTLDGIQDRNGLPADVQFVD